MRNISRRRFCEFSAALAGTGVAGGALAQAGYPSRPIMLVAPAAAGGLTDLLARAVADALGRRMHNPMVVENKEGAGGTIGMAAAARAPADGYSLILVFQGPATVAQSLYPQLPYDTFRDFAAIGMVGSFHHALTVAANSPLKTTRDVIEAARKRPGALTFGSAGVGTTGHLAGELFQREAGIRLTHVPYKGEAPALRDLTGGIVDMAFTTLAGTKSLADAGRVRIVGVASTSRARLAPAVPTIAESGLPGFNVPGWFGLMLPRKTPETIVARLRKELATTLKDPAFRAKLADLAIEPSDMTVAQFEEWLQQDTARWRAVIAKANMKAQ